MKKEQQLDELLDRFKFVVGGGQVKRPKSRFTTYAITNFRGGIGKSTLAFNLAWGISRTSKTLLMDACPQCNFSQSLLGEDIKQNPYNIYDALLPHVMAGSPEITPDDLITSIPPSCASFKDSSGVFLLPGSKELFLFPSLLYTQLGQSAQLGTRSEATTRNILQSVQELAEDLRKHIGANKVLIDTSPFFGGATHLAWVAAEALIIPVRVDQHSIEALKLTLSMLQNEKMDFLRLNRQAGIVRVPKIHAIVMTHCGWNRQTANTPDRSTQAYLSQVLDIANEHQELFSCDNPLDTIHLLDDFHSAGRISGSRRIPLAKLNVGESYVIEGQRLEVNVSLTRYQNELASLTATI